MNTPKYRWRSCEERDYYEELLRPDGTVVATLTEPEDRMWCRDLQEVIDELNRLYLENKELKKPRIMIK